MCEHYAAGRRMRVDKPRAKISNWYIAYDGLSLSGCISAHPRQDEFRTSRQLTSRLLRIDFVKKEAETENTIYELL